MRDNQQYANKQQFIFLRSTLKHLYFTLTDKKGMVLFSISTKRINSLIPGYKTKEYTIKKMIFILKKVLKKNQNIRLYINGYSFLQKKILRQLKQIVKIKNIFDKTPIPFNGCRPPKKRRK